MSLSTEYSLMFPGMSSVNTDITSKLEKEFININELYKLFMLRFSKMVELVYSKGLEQEIKYNRRIDSYSDAFSTLVYSMKKEFLGTMENQLKSLEDFFMRFLEPVSKPRTQGEAQEPHIALISRLYDHHFEGLKFQMEEPSKDEYLSLDSFLTAGALYQPAKVNRNMTTTANILNKKSQKSRALQDSTSKQRLRTTL